MWWKRFGEEKTIGHSDFASRPVGYHTSSLLLGGLNPPGKMPFLASRQKGWPRRVSITLPLHSSTL